MIVYKYRSGRGTKDDNGRDVFERDIELLSKDTIYIPTVSQLNDPGETLVDDSLFKVQLRLLEKLGAKSSTKPVEEGFHELLDKVRSSGVYSLSKEIVNELMWAYYASGHSGSWIRGTGTSIHALNTIYSLENRYLCVAYV